MPAELNVGSDSDGHVVPLDVSVSHKSKFQSCLTFAAISQEGYSFFPSFCKLKLASSELFFRTLVLAQLVPLSL